MQRTNEFANWSRSVPFPQSLVISGSKDYIVIMLIYM